MIDQRFKKSSLCHAGGCVEVALLDTGQIAIRDSKDPDSPVLLYTAEEWNAFIGGVKTGEFDIEVPQQASS